MSAQKILLMGLHRSGKSSIQQVVFHKMSPNETLFLESGVNFSAPMSIGSNQAGTATAGMASDTLGSPSGITDSPSITNNPKSANLSSSSDLVADCANYSPFYHEFAMFDVVDFPASQMDIFYYDPALTEAQSQLSDVKCLIYVMDAQDDYMDALSKLFMVVTRAHKLSSSMLLEVFIHKVDGLSDDHKMELQRDIQQRITDELSDAGLEHIQLNFHLTSIYDHSIYEAFSKIMQKLIPNIAIFENLLNALCANSSIEKAYVFDFLTKIYLATDSSPVDMPSYELACDMLDVVLDIRLIYGFPMSSIGHTNTVDYNDNDDIDARVSKDQDEEEVIIDSKAKMSADDFRNVVNGSSNKANSRILQSTIQLNNGSVYHLIQLTPKLALICLIRGDHFREKRSLIELNFDRFRKAFLRVVSLLSDK